MSYPYTRPPARKATSPAAGGGGTQIAPRELPKKLPVWQVISLWLAVVLLLPFIIFLLGGLSSLIGIEHILPPAAFYTMAQFSLLLAMLLASIVGAGYGVIYALLYRPAGYQLRLVLVLLAVIATLGAVALHGLANFF